MTKPRQERSPVKSTPPLRPAHRRLRRAGRCLLVLTLLALGGAGAWWSFAPAPPVIALVAGDPAVSEAIDAARREVWWHPHAVPAWARLGEVLRAHGYEAEANVCFAQAERLEPSNPRWPYLQGVSLQRDDPETAIRHLQRAVALCGSVPVAPELCLAEVYFQQGRFAEAEQHFRQVLQHAPHQARALLGLGRLAGERGDLTKSVAYLQQSLSRKPTKAAASLLAQVYHQQGEHAAAQREQKRAAQLPDDPAWADPFVVETWTLNVSKEARLARLKALHRRGRTREVQLLAEKLEDDYPDVYWLVEGRQQMDKGQWAAAEQALRKAVELAPTSVDAHFDLGTVLFQQKNYPAAAERFRKIIELAPTYGPAHERLGQCWLEQGNRSEAIRAFQTALRYMPEDAGTHRELGRLLLQDGARAEAQEHLRHALQLRPEDAAAKELLETLSH